MPDQEVIHKDMAGNVLHVGDYVAFAVLHYKTSIMKLGKIIALKHHMDGETIHRSVQTQAVACSYNTNHELRPEDHKCSTRNLHKLIKLEHTCVPMDVQDLIERAV